MRKYGTYCQYCQVGFSSEIEVPQLGSARAGKFQIGLITNKHLHQSGVFCLFWDR